MDIKRIKKEDAILTAIDFQEKLLYLQEVWKIIQEKKQVE